MIGEWLGENAAGWLLLAHFAATLIMVGVIWFVQLVHYPLFALVVGETSVEYAVRHQRATAWIVGPAMLVEAVTAVWIAVAPPAGVAAMLAWGGLALVLVNWLSTAIVQVPCHRKLLAGHDGAVIRRLVRTNWVRTAVWSIRGVLAGLFLHGAYHA